MFNSLSILISWVPYLGWYNVIGLVQVFGDDTLQVTTEFG